LISHKKSQKQKRKAYVLVSWKSTWEESLSGALDRRLPLSPNLTERRKVEESERNVRRERIERRERILFEELCQTARLGLVRHHCRCTKTFEAPQDRRKRREKRERAKKPTTSPKHTVFSQGPSERKAQRS
jgi:hypothetical protein